METLETRRLLAVDAASLAHPDLGTGTGNGSSFVNYRGTVTSHNGRYTVFRSNADNLVHNDTNGSFDVFRYDRISQTTELVSVRHDGQQPANAHSASPTVSDDGRYVAFQSNASDLVDPPTSGRTNIFVRDMLTGVTSLVSVNLDGEGIGNGGATDAVISADGSTIAFSSNASDLVASDTNRRTDIFAKRLADTSVILVSSTSSGAVGNGYSYLPTISGDGNTVAFASTSSNIVGGDNNNNFDVFTRRLDENFAILVSATSAGQSGNGSSNSPVISKDGSTVAFRSSANNLVDGDNNGKDDIFTKRLGDSPVVPISFSKAGMPGNGFSYGPTISADGSVVAFVSNANNLQKLVDDNNTTWDVFAKDVDDGAVTLVSVASTGKSGNGHSVRPTISDDGEVIAFGSEASDLLPSGANGSTAFVFARNLKFSTTRSVSSKLFGSQESATTYPFRVKLSGDGTTVAFSHRASIYAPNDNNGVDDVFVSRTADDDFGDAPASYLVTLANDGARHSAVGPHLGNRRDGEADGTASPDATGDDNDADQSDEDGVQFGPIVAGLNSSVTVNVQDAPDGAFLNAWLDFDGDGSWSAAEQVATDTSVQEGDNTITFPVPENAITTAATFARFRLSTVTGLTVTGAAPSGEVEDYQVEIIGDPVLSLSSDASVSEGQTGSQPGIVTVSRSHNYSTVTVVYATTDGTAVGDLDYVATTGTLTFVAGGPLTLPIPIEILGDKALEPDETFAVQLSNPANATLDGTDTATTTIVNDDLARVSLTTDLASQDEGTFGTTTTFDVLVTLLDPVQDGLELGINTSDFSATTADGDYTAVSQTLSFDGSAGELKTAQIAVHHDAMKEGNEQLLVQLSNAVTSWNDASSVVFSSGPLALEIVNDDMILPVARTGGPYSIVTGQVLPLNASTSFDADGITSFLWDLDNDGLYDDASGELVNLSASQQTALGLVDGAYPIGLQVTDATGAVATNATTAFISQNIPPVAVINGPYTLDGPIRDVMLDATGSNDPDGGAGLLYDWDLNDDQIYGDLNGELIFASLLDLQPFGFDSAGVFPIGLRVEDDAGGFGFASTTLTIINSPPTLDSLDPAMIMPAEPGGFLFTSVSATDPDDDSFNLTYQWDVNGDGDYSDVPDSTDIGNLEVPYSQLVEYGFDDGGFFPLSVRVSDPFGGTDSVFGSFEVIANQPPLVQSGGPYSLDNPLREVTFDATTSMDPDGDPLALTFAWDFDNDGVFDDSDLDVVQLNANDLAPYGIDHVGVFPISVQATDIYGKTSTEVTSLTINNLAPTSASVMSPPGAVEPGQFAALQADAFDPDDETHLLRFDWDLDGDGLFEDATGPTTDLSHSQLVNMGLSGKTSTIAVRATDPFGESVIGYGTLEVGQNLLPVAIPGGPYELESITRDLLLDGSTSFDPDGDPTFMLYDWDLDQDGQYDDANGSTPSFVLPQLVELGIGSPGIYSIGLRVTDMHGAFGYANTTLRVTNEPPVADAGGPYHVMSNLLSDIFLMGSATDPDDDPLLSLTYSWDLDGDGTFGDAVGDSPIIPLDSLRQLGLVRPQNPVALQVTDAFGASDISKTDIFIDYTPIVVTSILDVTDPSNDATELTLREAIELANSTPGPDAISLPAGVFSLTQLGADEDGNLTGDLDIIDDLIIIGSGAGQTVIDASSADDRVLDVQAGVHLALEGLSVTGGAITSEDVGLTGNRDSGAGIYNAGQLLLIDAEVRDNATTFGLGGGIYSTGPVDIIRSTIKDNEAATGGGLAAVTSTAEVEIEDSVFANNIAKLGGGGIFSFDAQLMLTGSTISGNSLIDSPDSSFTFQGGAGIQVVGDGGEPTLAFVRESTIANNSTSRQGGGIQILFSVALEIRNTIVANNSASVNPDIARDAASTYQSLGHNLIGKTDGGIAAPSTGDLIGTTANPIDARLLPLGYYSSPSLAHKLDVDSPAIDAGRLSKFGGYDQRGFGFPRSLGGSQDIGAIESGDDDGISHHIENAGPNQGDGNLDGILDGEQVNVASFPNAGDGNFVTIETTDTTTISQIDTFPIPNEAPLGVDFDLGVIDFTVREVPLGGTTTVTIYLDGDTLVDSYYKYGPTPDDMTDHWYEFLFDPMTGTGAIIGDSKITIHLKDGARGDDDLTQNGVIVDPGVPGFNRPPTIEFIDAQQVASAGDEVLFDAFVADPGDGEPSILWDFGDGSAAVPDELFPLHTFESAGTYTVTLTATDAAGRTSTAVTSILVLPDPQPVPGEVTSATINGSEANTNRSGISTITFDFDQAMNVDSASSLIVRNHSTSELVDLSAASLLDNGTSTVTWDLSNIDFSTGRYSAELPAASVASTADVNLRSTFTAEFHVRTGDVNGDTAVDTADFRVVGLNFSPLPGSVFRNGDANGDGTVDTLDFRVVGSHFGPIPLAAATYDFGDAPESGFNYPTTLASNGARHLGGGSMWLGTSVDAEADGLPTSDASGDGNDDDGVTWPSLVQGAVQTVDFAITAAGTGYLNAWIDFNADGDWDDVGEHILVDGSVTNGANSFSVEIPVSAVPGMTFARVRVAETAGYLAAGLAATGEVEDYHVAISSPPLSLKSSGSLYFPMLDEALDFSNRGFSPVLAESNLGVSKSEKPNSCLEWIPSNQTQQREDYPQAPAFHQPQHAEQYNSFETERKKSELAVDSVFADIELAAGIHRPISRENW